MELTNYGSRIEQIVVPDRNGKMGDVVLGYDNIDAVMGGQGSAGAFIGRYANRIAGTVMDFNAPKPIGQDINATPSVQLFSGNGLAGMIPRDQGKGGAIFVKHGGIAIEPMHYPDSPNQPSFPTTVINPNQTYTGKIVYKFGTEP